MFCANFGLEWPKKKASERKMKVSCVRQTSANVLMVNVYIILHCFSGV